MLIEKQRLLSIEIISDPILGISVYNYDQYVKSDNDGIDILSFFEQYSDKFGIDTFSINKPKGEIVKANSLLAELIKFIRSLHPLQFEKLSAIICKCLNFDSDFFATQPTKDQGIDFIAFRDFSSLNIDRKEYIIGQCKHFEQKLVDLKDVRELSGSVLLFSRKEFSVDSIYENFEFGTFAPVSVFYISNYFFSSDALELCKKTHIVPLDIIDVTCICLKGILENKINWLKPSQKLDKNKIRNQIERVKITS